jgi:hypothetical protein
MKGGTYDDGFDWNNVFGAEQSFAIFLKFMIQSDQ